MAVADPAVNRRGIVATLIAVCLWTFNDTCNKLASEVFPVGEMVALRGVIATMVGLVLVIGSGHGLALLRNAGQLLQPMLLLRAALDAALVVTFLEALRYMQLADVTAISQSTPIMLTVIAAAFGIERIGWRRFVAILVGFSGVVLVVKPTAAGLSPQAGLAILSAALVAVRDLLTRYIDPAVPSPVIALVPSFVGLLTGLGLGLGEEWGPVLVPSTLYLVASGILVTLGNLAIVIAFRNAEVGVIAPFRYFSILIALVLGYLIFDTLPDLISIGGIVLIAGSGVYTMRREHLRRQEAATVREPAVSAERTPSIRASSP